MRAGRVGRLAGTLAGVLAVAALARAADGPAEVRVVSGPGLNSAVSVRAVPSVSVEDRTAGAKPPAGPQGPASTGQTFADEITFVLRGFVAGRPAAIDVADPLVSVVRLFPEAGATTVSIFVRQPVTYTIGRPTPLGEVRVALQARARTTPLAKGQKKPPRPADEREVAVDAESLSYDQQSNTLTARGGVTVTREDTVLTADEVLYDRTNAVVEARGNVVVTDAQGTVHGDFAHLDLEAETGWIDHADSTLPGGGYTLQAGRLQKRGGPRYSVADGVFTTCECGGLDRPSWSIAGGRTDVTLEGIGVARDVTFRVKDVPVLWAPILAFPVNTQRASGFLMPRVGYSNRRGFQYEQPFFWAISKSTDATVGLDVETEARLGVTGEYRYALSRQTRGVFAGAYFNEAIRGRTRGTVEAAGTPADIPENRFAIAGHHRSPFVGKSRFYLDMFAVSDDLFLREINTFAFAGRDDVAVRSTRFTTSRAGVYQGWTEGLVRAETAYYQDLIDPQELALQRLPRIEAEHAVPLLGDRVVARLAGEAVNYHREDGYAGLRGDLAPELFVPWRIGRALNGSVTGRLRETAYHLTDREQVAFVVPDPGVFVVPTHRAAPELSRLDADRTRELAEVHARTGTELARVFDFPHLGMERLRHTVEPQVRWLYVPQVGRPLDELHLAACTGAPGERPGVTCSATLFSEGYLFDERDAINRRNFVSWGLTTRLVGRPAPPPAAPAGSAPPVSATPRAPSDPTAPAAESGAGAAAAENDAATDAGEEQAGDDVLPENTAQGLSADVLPMGPPAPPARGAAPAAAPPRELVRASILNGYDVSRELVGDSHLSDVDLGLRVTPVDWLGLTYTSTLGTQDASLRGLATGVLLREPGYTPGPRGLQSATSVALSYRFIESGVNQTAGGPQSLLLTSAGVNELDASVYLRLGEYLGFTFLMRYDLNTTPLATGGTLGPHFLERDYFVRLISACNCWVLEAGVADKTNPDERLFRVQFTLVGLGSFGKSPLPSSYTRLSTLPGLGRASGPGSLRSFD
jgi:LPS-assembly protein